MDLGVLSLAVALGVFFAYLVDRLGYPPLLGFLAAGFIAGSVLRLSVPDILLQMLIALVAFEAGRQLGSGSLSPAAFFAVILEAAFVAGLSISVFRLMGFSLREALIVAVMLLSSSSLLVLKFTEGLPPEARNVAISLTTLEDTVLFIALSLLVGKATFETLPVQLVMVTGIGALSLGVFTWASRYIVGKEYAIPFALAAAFSLVYVVQYFNVASPYLGAFLAGFAFSRTDTYGVHNREAAALSNLIFYAYMFAIGASLPTHQINPWLIVIGLFLALVAMLIRGVAVFFGSLFMLGNPRTSARIAVSTAHISELSISVPVIAYSHGFVESPEFVLALSTVPIMSLVLAPIVWRRHDVIEDYVARRVRELRTTVAYEKLYKVVTHAFITAVKLVVILVVLAVAFAYLGWLSLVAVALSSVFLVRYSRQIYKDLLIALRELEGARYASAAVLLATFSLAIYVVLVLVGAYVEALIYVVSAIVTVLAFLIYEIYSELHKERARRFNSSTTNL